MKAVNGTKEWAATNVNVCSGCSNDCLYCYARAQAIRFGRKTAETWRHEVIRQRAVDKGYGKRTGRVMLPTTHDITDATVVAVSVVARKLVEAGNELLIVSKPRPAIISRLIEVLNIIPGARDLVTWRFTIGSMSNATLGFWEPGAPGYADRRAALVMCHRGGWATSVSCEPMLEWWGHMTSLVADLEPYVTDTIWLGKMNHVRARVRSNGCSTTDHRVRELEAWQSAKEIRQLYAALKDHPLVRWKESVKKVLGLVLATEVGKDV